MRTYRNVILSGNPLGYWPMDDVAGPVMRAVVGSDGAYASSTAAPALGVAGAINRAASRAAQFDGVNDAASAAPGISGLAAVTLSLWLRWDAYVNNDDLAMEYSPNANAAGGVFYVDPNSPYGAGGSFTVGLRGTGGAGSTQYSFARPAAAAWHHLLLVIDLAAAVADKVRVWFDGAPPAANARSNANVHTGTFGAYALNLMCRNQASLFGAGRVQELAIYAGVRGGDVAAWHYLAGLNGVPGGRDA